MVQLNDLKVTCLIHDILYITEPRSFPVGVRKSQTARLEKLLNLSERAIVTSKHVESQLVDYIQQKGIKCEVKRFRLGVPNSREDVQSRPSIMSQIDGDYVVYVSSFNARKNHEFIINVWEELDGYRKRLAKRQKTPKLVLAGNPQSGFERFGHYDLQNKLKKSGIFVATDLTDEEINYLYANSLFTIYPSITEGWGIPPLESLINRKVCLVSNTVPSVQETNSVGLVKLAPDDHWSWLTTLAAFIERPHMREAIEKAIDFDDSQAWQKACEIILKD